LSSLPRAASPRLGFFERINIRIDRATDRLGRKLHPLTRSRAFRTCSVG
jgi:hypothetical protein